MEGGGGCGTACVCATVLQKGTKAPQAGGKIHTDFEKGFIMAEVRERGREEGRGEGESIRWESGLWEGV